MNPIFQQIIESEAKKRANRRQPVGASEYLVAKEYLKLKISLLHLFKDVLLILAGVFSAGFGLKGFLLPNVFIDGGVTGISLLVAGLTNLPLSLLLILINTPFIALGFSQLGKNFGIKSIFAIATLASVVALVDYPLITSDKLLVAVFGGFFLGAGIGLAVRGGAVLDGTEVLAVWISKKTGLTIGDVILLFNIIIFSFAAWLLSIETALYSILTYLAASKTVDFIVEGVDEYMGVTIISPLHEEIRAMIIEQLGRGATIYLGKGGFGKNHEDLKDLHIVFTVITRLEVGKLKKEIEKIDPSAFMVMESIRDIKGGIIKKRPLKH